MLAGPEGASVPSLGLSNKAVFAGLDNTLTDDGNDRYFVPITLTGEHPFDLFYTSCFLQLEFKNICIIK